MKNCAYTDRIDDANPGPVLGLLARTTTGTELLERFLPMMKRGKVRIAPYPLDVLAKLRGIIPVGQPIGACLVTEGDTGTIFLDYESPIGVLAPFLVHEISHSLEPKVWAGRTAKSQSAMLDAESAAFQIQFKFTQELRDLDSEYDRFLKTNYPKAKMLHTLLEFEAIEDSDRRRARELSPRRSHSD